ncbi:MAG: sulfur carrier protein ThiS [Candidatus Aenigmarchaeota archaeon]|nr:sulfur carrier protein ThiS [Candidatus Aenigmarchaeota archaeon]
MIKMRVTIDGKEIEINDDSTVIDSLKQLKLSPEIFLVKRNNEIIHENEKLKENDRLELIKVISGG